MKQLASVLPILLGLAVTACGSPGGPDGADGEEAATSSAPLAATLSEAPPIREPSRTQAPTASGSALLSCSQQIGAAAAARRVEVCRSVSPATHPPCNVSNSCAMIEDEIARSCALFDGKGSPMAGCTPAPKSMEAAADVVRRYYSALDARDYETAWQQWGEDGPPRQTRETFRAGFAQTVSTRVTIGRLEPGDAGAGSIYQPVPVTVDATLADGHHQTFRGSYVIRRVNDVDSASPAQLRWHIDSASLKAGPAR